MNRQSTLLIVVFGLTLHASVLGEIINVPDDQPSIQAAIDAAADGDEIIVAPDTYSENIDLLHKDVRLRSSAGRELTTIDGNGRGRVIVGASPNTVIDGFTITGGIAEGAFPDNVGGGMYITSSFPTVINCTFRENTADFGGGIGIWAVSRPTLINCIFSGNTANDGGGLYVATGIGAVLIDCTFSGNTAERGGGLNVAFGSTTVTNCVFNGNTGASGGGMYVDAYIDVSVDNCAFNGNSADRGGGMFNSQGSPSVTNSAFSGNTADSGGGMFNSGGSLSVTNCTFSGNTVVNGGGAIHTEGIHRSMGATVTNCILWNNGSSQIMDDGEVVSTVRYSDVEGGWSGAGSNNIDADPLFVDADGPDGVPGTEDDDLRLSPGSPTIDASDSTVVLSCALDLDGNERVVDDPDTRDGGLGGPPVVDMGAHEFGGSPQPDCNHNTLSDLCDLADGTSEDCNATGVPDECEIAEGSSADCNDNTVPDECEPQNDCNDNGVQDICDLAAGISEDCDDNGVPDECEQTDKDGDGVFDDCDNCNLFNPDQTDCQPNGVGDVCDLADGTSVDCNRNNVPDECEADCNGNGIADSCDIADGTSEDCGRNDVPDECEPDCNDNGVEDSCDIADGTSEDCDSDGIPDQCEGIVAPEITQQPVNQEVEAGDLAIFSVVAEGLLLEYQWRKSGEDLVDDGRILGSESATLFIFDVQASDIGDYDCVVTNGFGCQVVSDSATLTVLNTCPADIDGDGVVGAVDLALLLGAWGSCADPDTCPADFNADGAVGPLDLATLLGAWGPCP